MKIFVLWVGIGAFVLMGLFPPWLYTYNVTVRSPVFGSSLHGSVKPAGYYFILRPPPFADDGRHGVAIDCSRLLIQWIMVAVLTGGLLITFKNEKKD